MQSVLLHCHIFKNAGTTIDGALQRSFGSGFIDHRDDDKMAAGGMPYLDRLFTQYGEVVAVSSHQMPFDPDYTSDIRSIWYLVMLRDPIARALSVYRYERIQPGRISIGARLSKRMSIRDYFSWRIGHDAPPAIRNHHVRFLTNTWSPDFHPENTELQKALSNTAQSRVLVGIVEKFDESMVMFERKLAGQFPQLDLAYVKRNTNSRPPEGARAYLRRELGDDLFNGLLEENSLDMRLFAETEKMLDNYSRESADFAEHLRRFKQRCANLQRIVDHSMLLTKSAWHNPSE